MTRAGITAALLIAAAAGSAEARSPIEGRWAKGKMQIDIKPCGSALCGTVVKASPKQQAKAERGSGTDLVGATLIKDIRRTGPNSYRAPISARKAAQIARNVAGIVAVELIAGAQGVDFHAPLRTSARLQDLHVKVRAISPRLESDRYWADEMAALQAAVLAGKIGEFALSN